jgi:hypothetical protein
MQSSNYLTLKKKMISKPYDFLEIKEDLPETHNPYLQKVLKALCEQVADLQDEVSELRASVNNAVDLKENVALFLEAYLGLEEEEEPLVKEDYEEELYL